MLDGKTINIFIYCQLFGPGCFDRNTASAGNLYCTNVSTVGNQEKTLSISELFESSIPAFCARLYA